MPVRHSKWQRLLLDRVPNNEWSKVVILSSKMSSIDDNTSDSNYRYRNTKTTIHMVIKSPSVDLAPTSVAKLRTVINNLTLSNTGQFIS